MPRYDGPYKITKISPEFSTVTLDLPQANNVFPVFHTSEILPFIKNDEHLFPSCTLHLLEPVLMNNNLEHFIDRIIDKKKTQSRGDTKYLVHWAGQGPENDLWLPQKELKDCEALDIWIASKNV